MEVRSGGAISETREHIDGVRNVGTRVLKPLEHATARTIFGVVVRRTGVSGGDKTERERGRNRDAGIETETGKGRAGVSRLTKENIAATGRPGDLEREIRSKGAAILHLETAGKFSGKGKAGRRRSSGKEEIINPNGNGNKSRRTEGAASVEAWIVFGLGEAERQKVVAKATGKVARRLFQAVLGLEKEADETLAVGTVFDVAMRLLHEDTLLKGSLKEGSVDVEMVKAKVEGGSELKDGTEGGKLESGGESFGEVNAFDLGETLGDPASLVLFESAIGQVLVFENPLTLDNVVARFVHDEFPRLGLTEGRHLFVGGKAPAFGIRTGPGLAQRTGLNARGRGRRSVGSRGRGDGKGSDASGGVARGKVVTRGGGGGAARRVGEQ